MEDVLIWRLCIFGGGGVVCVVDVLGDVDRKWFGISVFLDVIFIVVVLFCCFDFVSLCCDC